MSANQLWKRTVWVLAGMLAGGVIGGVLTLAHVRAAPLEVPKNQPGIISATYVEDTLAVYTLRSKNGGEPILLMAGTVEAEMLREGDTEPIVEDFFGAMYLYEEDLREFPGPLAMAHREDDLDCQQINTLDTEEGLATLRKAFQKAYGRPPNVE